MFSNLLPRQWECFFSPSVHSFSCLSQILHGFKNKKEREERGWTGGLKESWTFVLSMNCERANELFQPLSTAFTDIPQRLHTQITCTMEATRRAWASQRSLAPNTSVYNQDRVGEKVGVEGVCLKSNVL